MKGEKRTAERIRNEAEFHNSHNFGRTRLETFSKSKQLILSKSEEMLAADDILGVGLR